MNFFKTFLAALLAFIVANIVLGILTVMVFAGFALSVAGGSSTAPSLKSGTVLRIDLADGITDSPLTSPFKQVGLTGFQVNKSNTILQAVNAIENATYDNKIKGIYINITGGGASLANVEELRTAILRFKESGKFVIGYGVNYSQFSYWLTSVADHTYIHPEGMMFWHGMSAQLMFYKGLLDKLGIEMQVVRHGTFKSAVEPYIMDRMSPENREQWDAMLSTMWTTILEGVSQSRGIDVKTLSNFATDLAITSPERGVDLGMFDATLYEDQVMEIIEQLASGERSTPHTALEYVRNRETHIVTNTITGDDGQTIEQTRPTSEKEKNDPRFISFPNYISVTEAGLKNNSRNKIAIIYADGEIIDGKSQDGIVGDQTVAARIKKARKDKNVKAIVMRVNSPGGSASASDVMWREMELARAEKPVIVSMGSMAASGGYYISCPADIIVADRMTLTGSIGVFGMFPNVEKAAREKLGITVDVARTNPHADLGSIFRNLDQTEKDFLHSYIEQVYYTFVGHVANGRNMTVEEVDRIGEGRVWSGVDAFRLGLIDGHGGIKDAIALAADRAGIADNFRVWEIADQPDGFSALLKEVMSEVSVSSKADPLAELSGEYESLKRMIENPGAYALMPYNYELR